MYNNIYNRNVNKKPSGPFGPWGLNQKIQKLKKVFEKYLYNII